MAVNIPPTTPASNPLIPLQNAENKDTDLASSVENTLKNTFDKSGAAKAKVGISNDLNLQALMDLFKPKETDVIV
jgi:hypothetical protein